MLSSSNSNIDLSPTTTAIRRVGRVERWLRKGFGFIIDLGVLQSDNQKYGWTLDEISGTKVFVYHNALKSGSDQVFHRLFAHEYVEYSIDKTLPTRDSRYQAFDVTGLGRSPLLCDLNNSDEPDSQSPPPQRQQTRSRPIQKQHQQHQSHHQQQHHHHQQPAPQTVVYYVPAGTVIPGVPFPPQQQSVAQEPAYVMPTSGIPVPK